MTSFISVVGSRHLALVLPPLTGGAAAALGATLVCATGDVAAAVGVAVTEAVAGTASVAATAGVGVTAGEAGPVPPLVLCGERGSWRGLTGRS